MTIPADIQRLVDAGTLVPTQPLADAFEDAYFSIPPLAHERQTRTGKEPVFYELWLTEKGECFIEENGRYTGPQDVFDGDVDSAVAWIEEQIEARRE